MSNNRPPNEYNDNQCFNPSLQPLGMVQLEDDATPVSACQISACYRNQQSLEQHQQFRPQAPVTNNMILLDQSQQRASYGYDYPLPLSPPIMQQHNCFYMPNPQNCRNVSTPFLVPEISGEHIAVNNRSAVANFEDATSNPIMPQNLEGNMIQRTSDPTKVSSEEQSISNEGLNFCNNGDLKGGFPIITMGNTMEDLRQVKSGDLMALIPCTICGDSTSGKHYGVFSCEGCKGFFRRGIKQRLKKSKCTANGCCVIGLNTRNQCPACRWRKCLRAGMCKEAVKFGRMSKGQRKEMLKIVFEVRRERSIDKISSKREANTIKKGKNGVTEISKSVHKALMQSFNYSSLKVLPEENTELYCRMGGEELQDVCKQVAVTVVYSLLKFVQSVPRFLHLRIEDRKMLLQKNSFIAAMVRVACEYVTEDSIYFNGYMTPFRIFQNLGSGNETEINSILQLANNFAKLRLDEKEIAIVTFFVILQDHPDLLDRNSLESICNDLQEDLAFLLNITHQHDLNTLNKVITYINQAHHYSTETYFQFSESVVASALSLFYKDYQPTPSYNNFPSQISTTVGDGSVPSTLTINPGNILSTQDFRNYEILSSPGSYPAANIHQRPAAPATGTLIDGCRIPNVEEQQNRMLSLQPRFHPVTNNHQRYVAPTTNMFIDEYFQIRELPHVEEQQHRMVPLQPGFYPAPNTHQRPVHPNYKYLN